MCAPLTAAQCVEFTMPYNNTTKSQTMYEYVQVKSYNGVFCLLLYYNLMLIYFHPPKKLQS